MKRSLLLLCLLLGCTPGPFFADEEVDVDGDGVVPGEGDCDDREPAAFPAHPEVCDGIDNDCDGAVDGLDPDLGDQDSDGSDACADCDDGSALSFPGAAEACDGQDNDCDGVVPSDEADADGDGSRPCSGDCDDGDAQVLPGALEACDGTDNDCSGGDDEADGDGDGALACADCDDLDPGMAPSLSEVCDGRDNDCDGQLPADERDDDADGFLPCEGDCDDGDASRYPGAPEQCNGIDDDCDSALPGAEADADGDGVSVCGGDCDDADAAVSPGLPDLCDGLDTDCDGQLGASELDADGDGVTVCAGDCADGDPLVLPGAPEVCDGVDTDCVGGVPSDEQDPDADGQMACAGDCDDGAPAVYDGAPELCDGLDNDCDTVVPIDESDGDGDGVRICAGDCDDGDPVRFAGSAELCDGVDNDCDGAVPGDEADGDGDGERICAGDCDDTAADRFLANPEVCDGVDNDCDQLVDDADLVDGDGDGDGPCADCDDANGAVGPSTAEVCANGVDDDCDNEVDEPDPGVAAPALLVIGGSTGVVRFEPTDAVWSGVTGTEVFTVPAGLGFEPTSALAGDLDEDGHAELMVHMATAGNVITYVGQAADCTGAWGPNTSAPFLPIEQDERLLASGDIDGDGFVDVVSVNTLTGVLTSFLGDDVGTFTQVAGTGTLTGVPGPEWAGAARAVDVDGDGFPDLVGCGSVAGSSTCSIHPGLGDGTFGAGQPFAVLALVAHAVALGDMDGDGAQDLVVGMASEQSGDVYVLSGDGAGGFGLPELFFEVDPTGSGAGRGGLATFDADDDGDDDLALVWDAVPSGSAGRNLQILRKDTASGSEAASVIVAFASAGTVDGLDPIAVAP